MNKIYFLLKGMIQLKYKFVLPNYSTVIQLKSKVLFAKLQPVQ